MRLSGMAKRTIAKTLPRMVASLIHENAGKDRKDGATRGYADETGGYSNAESIGRTAASQAIMDLREMPSPWEVCWVAYARSPNRSLFALLLAGHL
jgi:hypothetical protein